MIQGLGEGGRGPEIDGIVMSSTDQKWLPVGSGNPKKGANGWIMKTPFGINHLQQSAPNGKNNINKHGHPDPTLQYLVYG